MFFSQNWALRSFMSLPEIMYWTHAHIAFKFESGRAVELTRWDKGYTDWCPKVPIKPELSTIFSTAIGSKVNQTRNWFNFSFIWLNTKYAHHTCVLFVLRSRILPILSYFASPDAMHAKRKKNYTHGLVFPKSEDLEAF